MPSQFLLFWPKGSAVGNLTVENIPITTYTRVLSTREATEVVAQLNFDSLILDPGGGNNATITVTPQISADHHIWEDQTSFTAVTQASTYPTKEILKISDISEYMRFKIVLNDPLTAGYLGGTFSIHAVARWEEDEGDLGFDSLDELEGDLEF